MTAPPPPPVQVPHTPYRAAAAAASASASASAAISAPSACSLGISSSSSSRLQPQPQHRPQYTQHQRLETPYPGQARAAFGGAATPFPRARLLGAGEDSSADDYGSGYAGAASSTGARPSSSSVPPHVAAAFARHDRNRSGYLDYAELREALHTAGADLSSEIARQLVLVYDERPDGKLDLGEFAELCIDLEMGVLRSWPQDGTPLPRWNGHGGGGRMGLSTSGPPSTRHELAPSPQTCALGGGASSAASVPPLSTRSVRFSTEDANASRWAYDATSLSAPYSAATTSAATGRLAPRHIIVPSADAVNFSARGRSGFRYPLVSPLIPHGRRGSAKGFGYAQAKESLGSYGLHEDSFFVSPSTPGGRPYSYSSSSLRSPSAASAWLSYAPQSGLEEWLWAYASVILS